MLPLESQTTRPQTTTVAEMFSFRVVEVLSYEFWWKPTSWKRLDELSLSGFPQEFLCNFFL